jgi:hypothetical protein
MADWVTISSLGTAGGTLILAVATYGSVKSANRSARVAELSLLAGVRPVLIPSRRDAVREQRGIWIDLLYGDYEGGQRTIVRIGVSPWPDTEGERAYVLRYWNVDRQDPR